MIVYLAGPITGLTYEQAQDWRLWFRRTCPAPWACLDPLRGFEHLNDGTQLPDTFQGEFDAVARDLTDISSCDVVVVNLAGAERISIGTMCELGYARAKGKFIVTVLDGDSYYFGGSVRNPHDHLFVRQMSDVVVAQLPEAIDAILEWDFDYLELAA